MISTQSDSELKEEHLLNFVVNSLNKELSLDLGENVEDFTEWVIHTLLVPLS